MADERQEQRIVPCLWFDTQAEDAANHYVSTFPDGKILSVSRYGSEGTDVHGMPEGSVMTVSFSIQGQDFVALNGGPQFRFNEAVSFQVLCETQEEIDHYWDALSQGGDEGAQQCGWLKDRFGLSWQVLPTALTRMLESPDREAGQRAMRAMLSMKKFDIAALEAAYAGDA